MTSIRMKRSGVDFVIVGAGVFGVWTAHVLRSHGHTVALIDAYGAGNNRSSSGDESRIIRMGYGRDALYTRWAAHSLQIWNEFFTIAGDPLFSKTGVLWLGTTTDLYTRQTADTLAEEGIAHEKLSAGDIANQFPQISLEGVSFGVLEPNSGVLLARRAVQAVLDQAVQSGVQYAIDAVIPPLRGGTRLDSLRTRGGTEIVANTFIFACGAWLPFLFPEILATRIFTTRQEVFYFGAPAGSRQFRSPAMPVWLHHEDEIYGLPDIENRGVKIACDKRGPPFDPDASSRVVDEQSLLQMRAYLKRRFPELRDSPLLETRVCQYENTSNGDFLIDRHPDISNAWLVGGGSGHGFKHGPAVGKYVAEIILGLTEPENRFSFAHKLQAQHREVY